MKIPDLLRENRNLGVVTVSSRYCDIRSALPGKARYGGHLVRAWKFQVRCPQPDGSNRIHRCAVINKDPKQRYGRHNTDVAVSCDCEFFLYYCEYALSRKGASWIKYCNGQPPLYTNPSMLPLTCKHLHLAMKYVRQVGW